MAQRSEGGAYRGEASVQDVTSSVLVTRNAAKVWWTVEPFRLKIELKHIEMHWNRQNLDDSGPYDAH